MRQIEGRFLLVIKIGDKIAAAVLSYKRAHLRIGVVEKIHPAAGLTKERYTLRDDEGEAHIVSSARSVGLEQDEHHTMSELYEYRMIYNAHLFNEWHKNGTYPVVKSWNHSDGEPCFGGTMFIVTATLPGGLVSNHYKPTFWNLFKIPYVELPPEYDGHTPHEAAIRLMDAL